MSLHDLCAYDLVEKISSTCYTIAILRTNDEVNIDSFRLGIPYIECTTQKIS